MEQNMNGDEIMSDLGIAEKLARNLWRCFDEMRFRDASEVLAADFEAVWPNTRERIRGAENFIALNEAYPGSWRCTVEDVRATPEGVVTTTRISDGSLEVFAISFLEVKDGLIIRAEEYFCDVIDPPFDRSNWAERY